MSEFIIRLMANGGASDRTASASDVAEKLRQIGHEWKTADWAHEQEVVITVRPANPPEVTKAENALREIADIAKAVVPDDA